MKLPESGAACCRPSCFTGPADADTGHGGADKGVEVLAGFSKADILDHGHHQPWIAVSPVDIGIDGGAREGGATALKGVWAAPPAESANEPAFNRSSFPLPDLLVWKKDDCRVLSAVPVLAESLIDDDDDDDNGVIPSSIFGATSTEEHSGVRGEDAWCSGGASPASDGGRSAKLSAKQSAADAHEDAETPEDADAADEVRLREADAEDDFLLARGELGRVWPPLPLLFPLPLPLRCSALQRILMEFSVRPGSRAAIWLHLLPRRACVSTMILSSSGL